jgi:hypothetical protein
VQRERTGQRHQGEGDQIQSKFQDLLHHAIFFKPKIKAKRTAVHIIGTVDMSLKQRDSGACEDQAALEACRRMNCSAAWASIGGEK